MERKENNFHPIRERAPYLSIAYALFLLSGLSLRRVS